MFGYTILLSNSLWLQLKLTMHSTQIHLFALHVNQSEHLQMTLVSHQTCFRYKHWGPFCMSPPLLMHTIHHCNALVWRWCRPHVINIRSMSATQTPSLGLQSNRHPNHFSSRLECVKSHSALHWVALWVRGHEQIVHTHQNPQVSGDRKTGRHLLMNGAGMRKLGLKI